MPKELPEWLQKARLIKEEAVKNRSLGVYVQPLYRGDKVVLEYRDLELALSAEQAEIAELLKKSGVPRSLLTSAYQSFGSLTPKVLHIYGRLVESRVSGKRRFVALHVRGLKGREHHNQITSQHLLFARGFWTPMAISRWVPTEDINVTNLTNILAGLEGASLKNQAGKLFAPTAPIGLRLFDCLGWQK